jgi:adenylate cyclase
MEDHGLQRRRSTLLSADVVGYSRMMESAEHRTLQALLEVVTGIEREIARFGGSLVDAPGDNVLAEFPSETRAFQCALAIQRGLARRNSRRTQTDRLLLRIGLHSGELLATGGKLYGKTVNIAARLQQAAHPESVFLSEAVAERLDSSQIWRLQELGSFRYKNLSESVATLQACVGE